MSAVKLKWYTRYSIHGRAIVCETVINGHMYRAVRTPHRMDWTPESIRASVDHMAYEMKRAQEMYGR